jgi:hypothetical protein
MGLPIAFFATAIALAVSFQPKLALHGHILYVKIAQAGAGALTLFGWTAVTGSSSGFGNIEQVFGFLMILIGCFALVSLTTLSALIDHAVQKTPDEISKAGGIQQGGFVE